jgi:LCP family protein required for cell wall assembly
VDRETGKRVAGGKPQKQPKEKKPKKPSRLTRQQKVLIAVAAVLAVVLVGVLAWQSIFVRPDLENKEKPAVGDGSEAEEIDYGDGVQPRADGERKTEDWYTVLVLGRDTGGGGNCDTMMLASYNVTDQKLTVLNIPRDTMVNVPWDIKKINSVYNWYGGGEKGIQALYKEISQLVGFTPDFQVIVEWEAVGELVDAIGGVWFDVPRDMQYWDPLQDLAINVKKGYQLLDGDMAMQVVRFRDGKNGYNNGDIGRIETQQNFLKAVIEQLLKVQNVPKIKQLAKVFEENVTTDLSYQNLFWFGQQAIMGGLKMENIKFVTMPGNYSATCYSRTYGNMQSYVTPYPRELLELVNNELSPFVEKFTLSDLDIMSVNSDGSVSSSTGHVEDSKAAVAPVKPSKPETEPEEPDVDEDGNPIDPGTGDSSETLPGDGGSGGGTGTTTPPEGGNTGGDTGTTTPPEGGNTGGDTGTTTPPEGGNTGGDTGTTTPPEGGNTGGDTGTTTPPEGGSTDGNTGTTAPSESGGTDTTTPTEPDFSIIEPAPTA